MAENRNITYNLPNQIKALIGGEETYKFRACGAQCSSTGTEGVVRYKATDSDKTIFKFKFDVPYSSANSGNLTGGSANYDTEGGEVPVSGNSLTVDVTITQVK